MHMPHQCPQLTLENDLVKHRLFLHSLSCHFPLPTYLSEINMLSLFALEVAVTSFLLEMRCADCALFS